MCAYSSSCQVLSHGCCAASWGTRNDDTGMMKGIESQMKTVEDTATKLLKVFDSATRETQAFMNFDGSTHPW
jgi:hypothetical protein